MYDPKKVLTNEGQTELIGHIFNMKQAIFFFTNHADDLHIGALNDKPLDVLYSMQELLESGVLENGDGEEYSDPFESALDVCPDCGSGDVGFCNISVRPYCKECNYWAPVNHGSKIDAIKNWNKRQK